MAEALAVVSIVSSIVQLVDFTARVVARLNDFQSETNDIPTSLGHLKAELPVLLHTLQQIRDAIRAGRFPKECAAALLPVTQGCDLSIREIDSILIKTLPNQGEGMTKKVLKSLSSVWNEGKIEGITATLRGYIGTLTFYFTASSSILKPLTDDKLVKIRKWLSAPDPSINFEKALRIREASTGLWLIGSDFYRRWMAKASLVWLYGIPGCGKTVLSATVLENVLENSKSDPGKAVAYFYFDFTDQQKQDSELMVRSLVSQLSQQCIKILPGLNDFYSSYKSGQTQPSFDELFNVLQELVNEFPCTYFIIDALDECENRKGLMGIIKRIRAWQAQGLHVLFTSRREGDINSTMERILDDQNIMCIKTEAVDHDIELYVRHRLLHDESLQKWKSDDTIRQSIESTLTAKARGMFRLATCQLDIIGGCRNRKQLLRALETLPPNLDEMYNRILGAIKKDDILYAVRILRWLAFSSRPLVLAEIAEVTALDADRNPAFDRDEVLEDHFDVLSICSSLVTVVSSNSAEYTRSFEVPPGPLVLLAHYSVKEYLVSERVLASEARLYHMEPALCHRTIAKCCIQYLLQFDSFDALPEGILRKFALARYSAQQWVTHSKASAERDAWSVDLIIKLFKLKGRAFITWIRLHDPDAHFPGTDFDRSFATIPFPLYYACQAGLADVVRRLIAETNVDVNAQGGVCGNALSAASRRGHLDIVQILVEKGARVNFQSGCYGTALQAASTSGHLGVVQFLVDKGAEINAVGGRHGCALQAASLKGHVEVVKFLVEKGADVSALSGEYGHALQAAAYWGRIEVVQFLVEKGADVNALGGEYGHALQAASLWAHLEVLQFLLIKEGAEVNAVGGKYGCALQAASLKGHIRVVQFLVEKGAEVNAVGGKYGHALQAASLKGHVEVVRFLVEKGADVNALGGVCGHTLIAGLIHGHLEFLQFLVEKGADVNALAGKYGHALQAASYWGRLEVVQFLVEKNADIKALGGEYGHALQAASYRGRLDVVQFLIEKGADVNALGGKYGHALQAASYRGRLDIVQILVEKGADVNAVGGKYGHALQAASYWGRLDIVQFLVEKDADINALGGEYSYALQVASSMGHLDVVRFLVEKGAEINALGGEQDHALGAASVCGEIDIVRFLVENGADVNAQGGEYGHALGAASYEGYLEVVQFLVEKGADVNAQGGTYGHALNAASFCGHLDLVQFLVEKGADVNVQGGEYGHALGAASYGGYLEVVQFLVEKGAEIDMGDGEYGYPLQVALSQGHLDVVQFLVENSRRRNLDR